MYSDKCYFKDDYGLNLDQWSKGGRGLRGGGELDSMGKI